jgi:D-3-phosphoglycerate dehydrogenase
LAGKTVALIGFGDIGRNTAKRLAAADMTIIAYDPAMTEAKGQDAVKFAKWPERLGEADFIVVTCALTPSSRHMINQEALKRVKPGVRIVNVGRGPVIEESALIEALETGHVHSAALDVFEQEPLPSHSPLRRHPRCIFGSHNASNTADAVARTSRIALNTLCDYLGIA